MTSQLLTPSHLAILLVVLLLLFGPRRLPLNGRALGRTTHESREAISAQDTAPDVDLAAPPPATDHGVDATGLAAIREPRPTSWLAAALVAWFGWAAPAAASVQIGQVGSSPFTCGGMTTSVVWQHSNVTGPSYRVPAGGGVITSWTTGGGPSDGLRARLEMLREGSSSPMVVGEGNLETGVPKLNPYTFPARIPVQGGDTLGLETDSSLASICILSIGSPGDVLDGGPDPGPGNPFGGLGTPEQGVLNVAAGVEPDADHDGFGDESQDSCPSEAAVHSGPCQSGATRVGQTFQPTTPCDQGTYAPVAVPTGRSYAVPASGVLTSWNVQGPPAPHDDPIDFKVFRPTGPAHSYQVIAQSGLQIISGPGLHSFPFRLSVQTGDVIGFYSDSNSGWCSDFVRGAQHDFFSNVDVPVGQTTTFTLEPVSNFRADIAATIEPDRDGDGFGDITQDQCPTDRSRQSACPAPPATPPPPATAASISKVNQSAHTWRAGRRVPVISRTRRPPVGTAFRFTLDKAATVQFAFSAKKPGRRVRHTCLPLTSRNKRGRHCTRAIPAGTFSFSGHAGLNTVHFQGRLSRKRTLRPGSYTLTITATVAPGLASAPKRLTFTIVK